MLGLTVGKTSREVGISEETNITGAIQIILQPIQTTVNSIVNETRVDTNDEELVLSQNEDNFCWQYPLVVADGRKC